MPLPVIANVFRVAINWSSTGGISAVSVLHFRAPSLNEEDVFDFIDNNLTTNMLGALADSVIAESYEIIKLDGTSATQTFLGAGGADGQGTGEIIPASAAVLSLHTGTRGPRGRGRVYMGPTTEGNTSQGVINPSTLPAAIVAAWNVFQTTGIAAGVTHVVASYVHADAHDVTSYSMRPAVGTVRRRQNQKV